MKNVICIDLTKFNKEKLAEVAKFYELDYNTLLINKERGFAKLYIDLSTNNLIAHTSKKDKETIVVCTDVISNFLKTVSSTNPIPKKEKVLDVDTILDKISKYGVDSLSVNEKSFLDKSTK